MKIVIIGNGIAGSTAARHIRKYSDHEVLMISDETDFPFSRTALMYIYMGHMEADHTKLYEDFFWDKNKIQRLKAKVQNINAVSKNIVLSENRLIAYDKLIIATGSKSNKFGWPGQDLKQVQGLYHMQDLQSIEQASHSIKSAVIIGGGLIGIELAEMFHSRNIKVTFLVRETSFWDAILPPGESEMINSEITDHHIDLKLGTELKEIIDDGTGTVKAIRTNMDEIIDCQFVGLTVGVSPNISFLQNSGIETKRGVLVNEYLQTSIDDIYAIGDCAELKMPSPGRRNIEAIWYTGKKMGETVAGTITGKPTPYNPGIWYNSAKFFNIEYQVYGDMPAKWTEEIDTLYWQHENKKHSIRINYEKATGIVIGLLVMGIRYRHTICEKWIAQNATIEHVLSHLSLANFDPEFFTEYEPELINRFQQKTGKSIRLESKRKLDLVTRYLKSAWS